MKLNQRWWIWTKTLARRIAVGIACVAGCAGALANAAVAIAGENPTAKNVLFLMADDLNTRLGSYGDPRAKTPNLDRLAQRGVRFDRAYCAFPLCGPSRNSMLTGLYPNTNGVLGNGQIFRQTIPAQPSLPQAFRQQGYFAGRIGKLYHYNVPASIGTDGHDDPASWELEINPAGVDRLEEQPMITTLVPGQFGGTLSWHASPQADERHTDGMIARDAEWVLERLARQRERPFFLAVGFFRPHTPFVAPKTPYFDSYPEAEMPVVQGVKDDQADIPAPALAGAKREEAAMSDAQRRQAVQAYYASISFMDAQVGRVLDALDRLGLADSTVIVFASDHGYHLGEHGLWQKRSLFEESARVPLLVVAPGVSKANATVAAPVSLIDLFPTLAELCGINAPANLQGQSLVPMLREPSVLGRGWAITQTAHNGISGYSLRTPRWRYTEWEGAPGRELYDHDTDPSELTNLATDPAHAKTIEALSAQLRAAVSATFPPGGERPAVREGALWHPVLVTP
jgi:iduronate 2-sulfatase